MKPLAAYDCIALTPIAQPRGAQLRIRNALPKAAIIASSDRSAQRAALDNMQGAYVLLLPADILPNAAFASVEPDPILLDAGFGQGWLARNVVTGQCDAAPGPELWLREALIAAWSDEPPPPPKRAIMPDVLADWVFNYASRPAFTGGFYYAKHLLEQRNNGPKIMAAASFGSDMDYGDWWQLGLLNSLTGTTDPVLEQAREKAAMADGVRMQERLRDLRAQLNASLGLEMTAIDKRNAAFFRAHHFAKPDVAFYADLANIYAGLGKAGAQAAANLREAARWIWGAEAVSSAG